MATKAKIPSNAVIIREAIGLLENSSPNPLSPESIRAGFSDSLEILFGTTYKVYQKYERDEEDAILSKKISSLKNDTYTRDDVIAMLRETMADGARMGMSHKQSRASRAGKSFEIIVKELLDRLDIPNEGITREDKKSGLNRIDLVIPDRETAIKSPDMAHFLSLKTSLRERWMQVAEEQVQGQRTHLLTMLQNETLSDEVANKITKRGIFLYIPDSVKRDRFAGNPRIRGFSEIPRVVGS